MSSKFVSKEQVFIDTVKCLGHALDARRNGDMSLPTRAHIYKAIAEYKRLYEAVYGEIPKPEEINQDEGA